MSQSQPTRRNVIKAGAWAAPAIVVATSAPAFASSTNRTLTSIPGTPTIFNNGSFWLLAIGGLQVSTAGAVIPANDLRLTATFAPTSGNSDVIVNSVAGQGGWAFESGSTGAPGEQSGVYRYTPQVAAGSNVPFPFNSFFVGTPSANQGSFVLTFTALGFTPGSSTYLIPVARHGAEKTGGDFTGWPSDAT